MGKTPDGRQIYTCPTCNGARQVGKKVRTKDGEDWVMEDCRTCDGSGSIVGGPA